MTNKRYVALLRAINVGGHSGVKMVDLKLLFEGMGFSDVQTYIQTGNVVFNSAETDREELAQKIEQKLAKSLGYETKIFIFTKDELQAAADANPFEPEQLDKQQCHLYFLDRAPGKDKIDQLMAMAEPEYRFRVVGAVLYYAYDRKFVGNRRTINFEKVLGVAGTSRTWKVVDKLIDMA